MITDDPNKREVKEHEAWMAVSKKKAQALLEGLKSQPKEDPVVTDLKKELKDILQYWHRVETVLVGQNNIQEKPPKQGQVIKGKAADILLKKRNKGIK